LRALSLHLWLCSSASYSLQNKGRLFTSAKDQIQPIAVDLLNICANACVRSMTLGYYMAQHTALRICKLYKDPQTLWVRQGNLSVTCLTWMTQYVMHGWLQLACCHLECSLSYSQLALGG
jgi:hypothetical protein